MTNEYTYNTEGTEKYPSHIKTEVIGSDLLYYIKGRSELLDSQLDEIYDVLVGDNGRQRYTHAEIIDLAKEYYDYYKRAVDEGVYDESI